MVLTMLPWVGVPVVESVTRSDHRVILQENEDSTSLSSLAALEMLQVETHWQAAQTVHVVLCELEATAAFVSTKRTAACEKMQRRLSATRLRAVLAGLSNEKLTDLGGIRARRHTH
jgi:hypothetical protein|eukprot:COSAG02_NODE_3014_length_7551_cov_83.019995_4_plen_116_part_00